MMIIYYTFNAYIFVHGQKGVARTLARVAWEKLYCILTSLLVFVRSFSFFFFKEEKNKRNKINVAPFGTITLLSLSLDQFVKKLL